MAVRLLLPGRSDHPLVLHAGRSFLDQLLAAGVRGFEELLARSECLRED